MKCPDCGKELIPRITWTPSKGHENSITFSHVYTLNQLLKGPVCKYTTTRKTADTSNVHLLATKEEVQA